VKESRRFEGDPSTGRLRFRVGIGNVPSNGEPDPDYAQTAEMRTTLDGRGEYKVAGPSPQNEQWTRGPAEVLIQALGARGETWTDLRTGQADDPECDFVAEGPNGGSLRIQVTRLPDPDFWKQLKVEHVAAGPINSTKLAAAVFTAARRKAGHYGETTKKHLHLVIDGTWSPQALAQAVREELRPRWREFAELGFLGIWLVSPVDAVRLDEADGSLYVGPFRVVGAGRVTIRSVAEDDE
jgi:hypothetical protein